MTRSTYRHLMGKKSKLIGRLVPLLALLGSWNVSFGQCPEVFDFDGLPSQSPFLYSCSGGDFNLNLFAADNWGPYTIDWGDGSAQESGVSWAANSSLTHFYPSTVDIFNVVITETATNCVVNATIVMEEATSASIQIPIGGLTQACAPQLMEFINSSTNNSTNTVYIWDFGDGSPPLTFDHTNWNQTIQHTYQVGTVDCETVVSLSAENGCNTIQGGASEATFAPIRIWDLDDPAIGASAVVLCYPDTTFQFINETERNCFQQGNIYQRQESWNFGDYWGLGHDSIVDWTPWPPSQTYTMAYPGIGTYVVDMLDSNFCGVVPAQITVQVVPPPTSLFEPLKDTICVGESITFDNQWQTINDAQFNYTHFWDFGQGAGWQPAGGGDVLSVFNTAGTFTVCNRIGIASSNGNCESVTCREVVVLPAPTAEIIVPSNLGCDSLNIDFIDGSVGAMEWTWTLPDGDFVGQNPPTTNFPDPGNYVVNLLVEGLNGCLDTDQELITVYESPNPDFIINNVCQLDTTEFIDFSTFDPGDGILEWNWTFGDGATSTDQSPTHIYNNTGSFDVTLSIVTQACVKDTVITVDIDPAPFVDIDADVLTGCNPLDVQFENNSTLIATHQWSFGDGQGSNLEAPAHTFFNPNPTDTTYMVTYQGLTAFGCAGQDTLMVTVLPGATAGYQEISNGPDCAPYAAIFQNTSINADSYLWDFGDGTTTTEENPTHLFTNETGVLVEYDVTLIAYSANGCNDTIVYPLTAFPTPEFDISALPDSGCGPQFTVNMPFVPGAIQYLWDFGDGSQSTSPSPIHTFENNGQTPIVFDMWLRGVSPLGCIDTAYAAITVNPTPVAQLDADPITGCSPLVVTLENNSFLADSYTWDYGDGELGDTLAQVHTHTFLNDTDQEQAYQVRLVAQSDQGCTDEFLQNVILYPNVTANFDEIPPDCTPYQVAFDNTSVNADTYDWQFSNGFVTIGENPITTFVNNTALPETFSACLIATSQQGCTDNLCRDIEVLPAPLIDFEPDVVSGCSPLTVTFENNSQFADEYLWFYGDNLTSDVDSVSHTHTYTNGTGQPFVFDVTMQATNAAGCTAIDNDLITVYPPVLADFQVINSGCSPLTVQFENFSSGANQGYTWNFGNGFISTVPEPQSTFENFTLTDTLYNVQLVAESLFGCVDTTYQDITVFHLPLADIAIDSTAGCYPLDVTFGNYTQGAVSYEWSYGTGEVGGTADTLHTHTFFNSAPNPVTYNTVLTAYTENNCEATDDVLVQVLPQLIADFESPMEGCSPFTVQFEDDSFGVQQYTWDFGDGDNSTLANPQHTFSTDQPLSETFEVKLVVESYAGCLDSLTREIIVWEQPEAEFEVTPEIQIYPEADVILIDMSTGADLTYTWQMGDGAQLAGQAPGMHTYNTWGGYDIELEVTNQHCSSNRMRSVEVLSPPPVANFEGPAAGCAPLVVNFENLSEYGASYQWNYGDGTISNAIQEPKIYTVAGTYTVTLTVTGFNPLQTDVMVREQIIEVYPRAFASFEATPNQVSIPTDPVNFINTTVGATSYLWDFGDGNFSTDAAPTHLYTEPGSYDIMLIAESAFGCPDTLVRFNLVEAVAAGELVMPNAFTPSTLGSNGGQYDPSALDNNIFFPIYSGVKDYEMQVFNRWGELIFSTTELGVGWDGYYKGKLCKRDVYAWKIRAKFEDGRTEILSGDVTLLR